VKHPTLIGGAAWAAALKLGAGTAAHAASAPQAVAAGTVIDFDVDLPAQPADELDQFLEQLHDPSSANFRYLADTRAVQSRFGASAADISAVGAALAAKGRKDTLAQAGAILPIHC
jgi:Pro-kumamolisin, activation domain